MRKKNEMFVFRQREQRIVNERWWKFEPKLGSKHEYLVEVGLEFFKNPILNLFTYFFWLGP